MATGQTVATQFAVIAKVRCGSAELGSVPLASIGFAALMRINLITVRPLQGRESSATEHSEG
jgi:hypothetical protein